MNWNTKRMLKKEEGFTLIEILVSFALIGIVITGIFSMLMGSKSMQAKADELDQINMMVSGYIELLRNSTDEAIAELGLQETDRSTSDSDNGNSIVQTSYSRIIYLDSNVQISNKDDSKYRISICLNSLVEDSRESFLIPDMHNKRRKSFDLFPAKNDYIFWVLPALEGKDLQDTGEYTQRNYEIVVINGEKAEKYKDLQDYVVDWAQKIYPEISVRTDVWSRSEILSSSYYWKFLFAEIRNSGSSERDEHAISQFDIDQQNNNFANVRGSVPVRVDYLAPPQNGKPYTYYVVNEYPAAIDFYIVSEEENPMFEIKRVKGLANLTYLKADKDKKRSYDFTITVTRNSDQTKLIEYKSGYYYAD